MAWCDDGGGKIHWLQQLQINILCWVADVCESRVGDEIWLTVKEANEIWNKNIYQFQEIEVL